MSNANRKTIKVYSGAKIIQTDQNIEFDSSIDSKLKGSSARAVVNRDPWMVAQAIQACGPADSSALEIFEDSISTSGIASFYSQLVALGSKANMSMINVKVKDGASYLGTPVKVFNLKGWSGDEQLDVGNDIITTHDFMHGCIMLVNKNMPRIAKKIAELGDFKIPMSSLARVSVSDEGLRGVVDLWEDMFPDKSMSKLSRGFDAGRIMNTNVVRKAHQMVGSRANPYKFYWKELAAAGVVNGYMASKRKTEKGKTITFKNLNQIKNSLPGDLKADVVTQLISLMRGNSELDASIKDLVNQTNVSEIMKKAYSSIEQKTLGVLFDDNWKQTFLASNDASASSSM